VNERSATERLHALQSVTDAALSHLPLEEMLQELLVRVTELLDTDTAAILLLEEDGRYLLATAAKGIEEEVERHVRVPVAKGFAGRIAAERRPVAIFDVETADIFNPILREKGLKSLLGVPLMLETQVIGVLHVGTLTPREWRDGDTEVLQRAADRAALAVGGRLVERERGLAEAFQHSLIPSLPRVPGIALAGRYRPAASAQLGGDWYDAFTLPTGAVGVAIGDVVGRGFQAAALMGQLRSALRAYAVDLREPSDVLTRLSSLLRQLQPGWSATLLYAVLEPHSGRGTVASAAHPPPLVRHEDRKPEFLVLAPSVPLAAVRDPAYEDVAFELPGGSMIVLYTDGLVERPGESLDTGLERLREAVGKAGSETEAVASRLLQELVASGPGADDSALLVVTVERLSDPFVMKLPVDPDSIPVMRRVLSRWLDAAGASRQEVDEITLACSEACANAVEHAYGPGGTDYEVKAASAADAVTVAVRDAGQWREPRGTHRGRGMTLMKGLMDSVEVGRSESGTVVRMSRRLAGQAA
jgi:anti-sigma regulatory factor (Ser/Thr protein kinase)/putative methionine-R-sulfoxide reductase with GAF domain